MTSFTIIGTGNMSNAIGGLLADGGSSVGYIGREQIGTLPLDGEVVVLAVPYPAVNDIVAAYGSQWDGKIVVDITNPLNFETFDSLVVPVGSSAAAEIQAKIPQARVLKAFNTTFAATVASKTVGANQTTVLIAGDDTAAKQTLAEAIVAGGVAAIDAGSLDAKSPVDVAALVKSGLLSRARDGVKLLGHGEFKAKVEFTVWRASKSAVAAVEKAGGSVKVLAPAKEAPSEPRGKNARFAAGIDKPKIIEAAPAPTKADAKKKADAKEEARLAPKTDKKAGNPGKGSD